MVKEVATPRRRSSRIRDKSPQKLTLGTPSQLDDVAEREETPDHSTHSPTNAFTSPEPPIHSMYNPLPANNVQVKTPTTATKIRPSFEEMHPSRFQSTAKKMASGTRLSTVNARTYMHTPSKSSTVQGVDSPRVKTLAQESFASPGFEFKFRQSTDMSSDTQKMMDDIREQAARIKEGLAAQREEQLRKDSEAEDLFGRRLATPKGKIGRFSDVHLGQFKKMNSIANHPSSFRTESAKSNTSTHDLLKRTTSKTSLGKVEPSNNRPIAASAKSLKRSPSKAELDRPETPSKKMMPKSPMPKSSGMTIDPEEIHSPAKRFKQHHDAGHTAPLTMPSSDALIASPAISRPKIGIPMLSTIPTITTPTKASMIRSASVKNLKTNTSMIPSLMRSPSTKSLATPSMVLKPTLPQTEGGRKYGSSFASKLSSVKSILRRPQIRFSDDPVKIAAGTHVSTPTKSNGDDLRASSYFPSVPEDMLGTPNHRKEKHVNFSVAPGADKELSQPNTPATPSPTKMPGSFPAAYPHLPDHHNEPATPTHAGLGNARVRASIAAPGDFTFRADKTISFTPGGRSTPTIRQVRASDTVAYANLYATAEKLAQLPSVPHGLSNKKRKRESVDKVDSTDDKENKNSFASNKEDDDEEEMGKPTKRARMTLDTTPSKPAASKAKFPSSATAPSRIPRHKSKGFLSLSRLNALSKPKERK